MIVSSTIPDNAHPNLRFFLICLATCEANRIPSLLYRYQASFYLWWIRSVLKYCKVSKYYGQDCRKIFFLLSTLPMMIQISEQFLFIWLKNVTSIEKLPISKVESFWKSSFLPKSNMQNSAYTKPLNLDN